MISSFFVNAFNIQDCCYLKSSNADDRTYNFDKIKTSKETLSKYVLSHEVYNKIKENSKKVDVKIINKNSQKKKTIQYYHINPMKMKI